MTFSAAPPLPLPIAVRLSRNSFPCPHIVHLCIGHISPSYSHIAQILARHVCLQFSEKHIRRQVTGGNDKLEQANPSAVYTVTNKAVSVYAFLYYMSRAGFMRCPKANFQRLFSCAGKTRLLIIFSGFRHSICISYFDLWCATYYQQNPTHQTESKRSEQT